MGTDIFLLLISGWKWIWRGHEDNDKSDESTTCSTTPSTRNASSTNPAASSTAPPDGLPTTTTSTESDCANTVKKSIKKNRYGAIYANIRGLYPKSDQSKLPYLSDLARESNSPFICLTETHLTPDVLDAEISIEGYNLFRSDRQTRSHGGVCTYVRKDLAVVSEIKDSDSFCDFQILHLPQLNLSIANIYRPPNCPESSFIETIEKVSSSLRTTESQRANDYLVLGDFNFPFLNFKGKDVCNINEHILRNTCKHCISIETCSHTTSERRQAQNLLNFAEEFFLQQYISKSTRKHNILDLVFTNNHHLIQDYHIVVNS